MIPKQKKKAFTLTELLVVVLIAGVLAAVALPKFNRAIETRKTGEAEEVLSAIRNEQEKRCTLDRPYAGTFKQMGDLVASSAPDSNVSGGGNYTYVLENTGVSARSAKNYSLRIPSYTDGRICCEGDYCDRLNKNYPKCDTFTPEAALCVTEGDPEPPVFDCANRPSSQTRNCNTCGTQTSSYTCDTSTGNWTESWGACSVTNASLCPKDCGSKPSSQTRACNTCGTQTSSYTCNTSTGNWTESWTACSKQQSECGCSQDSKNRCLDNYYGPAGSWNESTCTCTCPFGSEYGQDGSCECNSGYQWDERDENCRCWAGTTENIDGGCCPLATPDYNPVTKECYRRPCRDESYKQTHKSECCPGTTSGDKICWTRKDHAVWKFTREDQARDCQGMSGNCPNINPAGDACSSVGSTCNVIGCSYVGGGSDWGDQYQGESTVYTCTSSGTTYEKNGW